MAQRAKKRRKKTTAPQQPALQRRKGKSYSAGEIFAALVGAAVLLLIVGLVITSILE